jgi:predicted hydrolase (HD superfamily)
VRVTREAGRRRGVLGATALLHDFDYEIRTAPEASAGWRQILREEGYPEE